MIRPPRFDAARRRRHALAKGARGVLAVLIVAIGAYWLLMPDTPPDDGIALRQPVSLCAGRTTDMCVIDGDTIMIGRRKIRMQGYDAPELDGACPAESALAGRARDALLAWLATGAAVMDGDAAMTRDQYGRELRRFWRTGDNGTPKWLADHMTDAGLANRGWGGAREWC